MRLRLVVMVDLPVAATAARLPAATVPLLVEAILRRAAATADLPVGRPLE